jgi:hypothetical protein
VLAKPVVAALNDEDVSASQMLAAVKAAGDVKLPALAEVALGRELNQLAKLQDFDGYFGVLAGSTGTPTALTISELEEDKHEAFITRSTIKLICDLCRQEKKADMLAKCAETAHSVLDKMAVLNNSEVGKLLLADLLALVHVTNPMQDGLSDADLLTANRLFELNKSHRLHKPLVLFPTGQTVMLAAAAAVLARTSDAGFENDLLEVQTTIAKLPEKPSVKVAGKTVAIVNVTIYRKLFELMAKIQAGASDRFKSNYKQQLDPAQQIQDKLHTEIQVLGSAWDSQIIFDPRKLILKAGSYCLSVYYVFN